MSGTFDPYHRWLGIPLKDQPPNHYRLLAIDLFEADPEVIRDAAEQRMAHVRTYQLGRYADLSQRILNELAAAKACLLEPQKKAVYDQRLRQTPGPSVQQEAAKGQAVTAAPRWLLPTAIGGVALAVAGVVFVLARSHGGAPLARLPDSRKSVESERAKPSPTPANANKPSDSPRTTPKPETTPVAAARNAEPPGGREATSSNATGSKPTPDLDKKEREPAKTQPSAPSTSVPEDKTPIRGPGVRRPPLKPPSPKKTESKSAQRPDDNGAAGPFRLVLPSGATLTEATFEAPESWQRKLFPAIKQPMDIVYATFYTQGDSKPALSYPNHPNAHVQGVFACRRDGSLHGAAATLDEDDRLQTLASYLNGKMHGSLLLWSENGERRFYGQYKNGKKDGLICLFERGTLQLIQECSKGNVQESYLVRWTQGDPSVTPTGELPGNENAEMNKAIGDLKTLETEIAQNERKLKSKLKAWVRRWQVALQAPGKLQRQLDKVHERNEQQREGMERVSARPARGPGNERHVWSLAFSTQRSTAIPPRRKKAASSFAARLTPLLPAGIIDT